MGPGTDKRVEMIGQRGHAVAVPKHEVVLTKVDHRKQRAEHCHMSQAPKTDAAGQIDAVVAVDKAGPTNPAGASAVRV